MHTDIVADQFGARPRSKMDTVEAADYCRLGKSTLEKLRLVGNGPPYSKIGGRIIYDRTDLDTWIERHKRASTSTTPSAHAGA